MNGEDKLRITKNWIQLTTDLDFKDIAQHLIQDGTLTLDDVDEINTKGGRKACVEELLAKLIRKGPTAYRCFRQALTVQYPWIVKQLDATDVGATQVSTAGLDTITDLNPINFIRLGRNDVIQKNWRNLGRCLGVEEADLVNIEYENRQKMGNLSDLVFEILLRWTQIKGSAATVDNLKECLCNIGVTSLT